ncbi:MAG: hypothetical protein J6A83_04385 [Clostridia bacterium]|nr:hypothetical protein [Clostridia bacterium]
MVKEKNNSGKKDDCDARRIRRIASAIIPLFFLSLFLAAIVISVANDMYAFVKPAGAVTLQMSGEETLLSVARRLEREGVVNNPLVFCAYVGTRGAGERIKNFEGEIELDSSMSYREILRAFS